MLMELKNKSMCYSKADCPIGFKFDCDMTFLANWSVFPNVIYILELPVHPVSNFGAARATWPVVFFNDLFKNCKEHSQASQ